MKSTKNISKLVIMIVIIIFIFMITYFNINSNLPAKTDCKIKIKNNNGELIECLIELADTESERAKGLMYRNSLCNNCGMLFVFNSEKILNFWMKNTKIPLSIAFINKDGIIIDIQNMKPFQTFPSYESKYPAKYALEVNKNWFKKNNIKIGSRLIFNGCIGK